MNVAQTGANVPAIVTRRLVGFQDFLRTNGYCVGIPEVLDALSVAREVDVTDRRRLRAGLKSLLCSGRDDWSRFDELFDAYWLPPNTRVLRNSSGVDHAGEAAGRADGKRTRRLLDDIRQGGGDAARAADGDAAQGGASSAEIVETRDFRFMTEGRALQQLEVLADRLAKRMRRRMIRRQQVNATGRQLHLRRTLRNSLQYGGMPVELSYRRRRKKPPQLVMLLDVSRSMSIYTYMLLRFTRAVVCAFRRADAFVFHTRLVPVSDALKESSPERMRDRLMLLSAGWSGGTRIGESLREFNDKFAPGLVGRRTIVVMVSDGFDTGEPALLGAEMRRLKSASRRVVWLNPLLGRAGYRPVSAGIAEALPWVDLFAPAHNLDSLLALESELLRL